MFFPDVNAQHMDDTSRGEGISRGEDLCGQISVDKVIDFWKQDPYHGDKIKQSRWSEAVAEMMAHHFLRTGAS